MIFNKLFLTTLLALLFSITGRAQDLEKQSLHHILRSLEVRHSIVFTYVDENINSIYLPGPPDNLNLSEALIYLQNITGLQFEQLNERYVTINKKQSPLYDICGIITYSDTGETVDGASIQSGNQFAISKASGIFQLHGIPEDSMVHIRFVGYKDMDIPVHEFRSNPCKKIILETRFTTLQAVFVSDFISAGIDKKVDGSLMIRAETLGPLPGLTEPDVLQTLQTLPGIQSINETISDINVRGGSNDQNLILWDGIRMYHSGHFFGLISAYNPYLTETASLIKNGSSAAFGDGVSSTIDIRTGDQLVDDFMGGAGINMINGDVFAKVPISPKASLQVSSRRSVADIFPSPAYHQYFRRAFGDTDVSEASNGDTLLARNEKFYFYDASLKLIYNISTKDKLRVSFLNVFNDIQYQENALINNLIESRRSGLEQQNLGSGISYSRLWNDKTRTSAQLYLSSYDLGAINNDLQNDQRLIQKNEIFDTGIKVDTRVSLGSNIDVLSGYQFSEVGVTNLEDINNPSFRRVIKKVVRSHAVFSEGNFTFGQANMRLGIRGNYFPGFRKLIIEPRLSFNQNFYKHFFLEVLGELKNQTITQIIDLQTDFLGVEKRRWVLSNNEDIPLIRSRQLSVGIYYKNNSLLISVEGYAKVVNGIITSSQGFQNQFQFIRSPGNYQTQGFDFLMRKKFNQVATWFSYSNAKSSLGFNLLAPPVFPNNLDIRHRATLGCSYQRNNIEFSSGLNWHSGKPFTKPVLLNEVVGNKINYDYPNSSRLDDYLRLDLSARYQFRMGNSTNGQIGVSVWNVLNKENIINRYFELNINNQIKSVEQFSLGLTPNVIFRVKF